MSDLQDKLNQILQNPEAMKQVQSLGAQLGLTGEQKQPPKPKPPENNLMSMIGGDDTIGTIAKFAPLLNSLNNSDDTTRLLDSLRPFLSHERQEKLDKAEKMLKLFRLMPLLRENGLFCQEVIFCRVLKRRLLTVHSRCTESRNSIVKHQEGKFRNNPKSRKNQSPNSPNRPFRKRMTVF